MKLFYRIISACFLLILGLQLRAQNATFSLVVEMVNDSSFYYNDTIRATLILTYNAAQVYQGNARVGYQTSNSGVSETDTLSTSYPIFFTAPGQSSVLNSVDIPVSPSFFIDGGGHTVIVWPVMTPEPFGSTIDSSDFDIEVLGWLNQTEWAIIKQASIFPVPATDFLMLDKPVGKANVTILDIQGRVVTSILSTETQIRIPLQHLASGKYFLKYHDGIKPAEIHSFIKQ